MRGCGAIVGAAVALFALYFVWLWLAGRGLDIDILAGNARCLLEAIAAIFLIAAIIIMIEPKGDPL